MQLFHQRNLIISVINQLNLLRFDEQFNTFIDQFDGENSNKRKRVLTNFPDSIIDSTVGYRDPIYNQHIKVNLYFKVLDTLIHELNYRFLTESITLSNACTNLHHCNYDLILVLLQMYNSIFSTSSIHKQFVID